MLLLLHHKDIGSFSFHGIVLLAFILSMMISPSISLSLLLFRSSSTVSRRFVLLSRPSTALSMVQNRGLETRGEGATPTGEENGIGGSNVRAIETSVLETVVYPPRHFACLFDARAVC